MQKVEWCLRGTGGAGQLLSNGCKFSLWEDEEVLEMSYGDGCATM